MEIKLTQEEAENLLSMLKKSLINELDSPEKGKNTAFEVVGETSKDLFSINIFRGKINKNKVSYSARITKNNIILLELHLNPTTRHRNPDDEIVTSSHWHIYQEGYDNTWTFPASEITDNSFVDNTIVFLKKFNVIEIPTIHDQLELCE